MVLMSGLGAPLRDANSNARFGYIDTAAGHDLASLYLRVDRRAGHDDHVVAFAGRQPLLHAERAGESSRDLVAGGFFELRSQLAIGLFGGLRGKNFDFSSIGHGGQHQRSRCGNNE